MKFAVAFLLLACACVASAIRAEHLAYAVALAALAASFTAVAAGYGFIGPRVFLKSPAGVLNPLSLVLIGPFHLLNALTLALFQLTTHEHAHDEIVPGLRLGRMLTAREGQALIGQGVAAVLDLTGEFSEAAPLRRLPAYLCIPLLDTRAPTAEQLQVGVEFIASHLAAGGVYVHCAMGHGRSATFVAAYLIHAGQVATIAQAEAAVQAKRSRIGLNRSQREAVAGWSDRRR